MIHADIIIFDLDGTLIDSKEDIANAVNYTLRNLGLNEKSLSEISSYIGTGSIELIEKSLGKNRRDLIDKGYPIFLDYYKEHYADKTTLYPGVKDVSEYFRDKKKIIVTNRNYETAVLVLKKLGIYDYFEDITGGDDPACLKPNSCPLDNAMRKLNVTDKRHAIIVGDMDIDVLTGKKTGIATCAVTYGIGKKEDIVKSGPDYIIGNIAELKEIIK